MISAMHDKKFGQDFDHAYSLNVHDIPLKMERSSFESGCVIGVAKCLKKGWFVVLQ